MFADNPKGLWAVGLIAWAVTVGVFAQSDARDGFQVTRSHPALTIGIAAASLVFLVAFATLAAKHSRLFAVSPRGIEVFEGIFGSPSAVIPWGGIADASFERASVDAVDVVVRGFKKGFGAPTRPYVRLSVPFAPKPVFVPLPYGMDERSRCRELLEQHAGADHPLTYALIDAETEM